MTETVAALFRPEKIFIDRAVRRLGFTEEILGRLGSVESQIVDGSEAIKALSNISWKGKVLLLTSHKGDCLSEFTAMTRNTGRPTYSLNLISNCHLDCSYCFLQGFLANSPIITIYTNMDEIMNNLADELERIPRGAVIGTGQVSDSLALEDLTGLHKRLIPFFGQQDRVRLEMKTKCANVSPILSLKHGGQTVVSWSITSEQIHNEEESKTASISDRISAMSACQNAGYSVGLHFDPVIHHIGWEKNYKKLVDRLFTSIDKDKVSWVSIGTLRFPVNQVTLMRNRYPNNRKIFNNLISRQTRIMHYPEGLRDAIYRRMREYLSPYISKDKIYISVESEFAIK
jgi:spore photoproduct lyase